MARIRRVQSGFTLLLCLATALVVSVPCYNARASENSGFDLLTADQGNALADFALQSGTRLRPKPDCSHLVHLIYSRAGLPYPYEGSRVLYRGVPDFERVKKPQAGDLIVWPGHVGIVVSPAEKVFFSSVRSGIITESWVSDYWLDRGRPRFFRYRMGPDSSRDLEAALMRTNPPIAAMADSDQDVPNEDVPAADIAVHRNPAVSHAPSKPAGSSSGQSARSHKSSEIDVAPQPSDSNADASAGSKNRSSRVVAVIRQRKRPGKEEIAAAFSETSQTLAGTLTGAQSVSDPGQLQDDLAQSSVSIFSRVQVSKIRVGNEGGSVTLRLMESISLDHGKIGEGRTTERELLIHASKANGVSAWEIIDPQGRMYLPQQMALSVFQHQAELLLHRAPASAATRSAVKVLDLLYDQQPDPAQRASLK